MLPSGSGFHQAAKDLPEGGRKSASPSPLFHQDSAVSAPQFPASLGALSMSQTQLRKRKRARPASPPTGRVKEAAARREDAAPRPPSVQRHQRGVKCGPRSI